MSIIHKDSILYQIIDFMFTNNEQDIKREISMIENTNPARKMILLARLEKIKTLRKKLDESIEAELNFRAGVYIPPKENEIADKLKRKDEP